MCVEKRRAFTGRIAQHQRAKNGNAQSIINAAASASDDAAVAALGPAFVFETRAQHRALSPASGFASSALSCARAQGCIYTQNTRKTQTPANRSSEKSNEHAIADSCAHEEWEQSSTLACLGV